MARALTNISMLPLITPEDRVIITSTKLFEAGDIIAFTKGQRIIVHRIVYTNPNKNYVITRGDNNLLSDGKIPLDNILGLVTKIKRKGKNISIKTIYVEQSIYYTKIISTLCRTLAKYKIRYVLLKGLPVHIRYSKSIPNRVYSDCDILVSPQDKPAVEKIFTNLGFVLKGTEFLGRKSEGTSQVNYVYYGSKFPVVVDLHFDISIGLTKVLGFNKLIPSTQKLTSYFIANGESVVLDHNVYRLLNSKAQLIYLLLHYFHHNFLEFHRLELISKIYGVVSNQLVIVSDINRLKIQNFVYPALILLNKYYCPVQTAIFSSLRINPFNKFLIYLLFSSIDPSVRGVRVVESIKRYIYILLLSPVTLSTKLKVLLSVRAIKYYFETIIFLARSALTKAS